MHIPDNYLSPATCAVLAAAMAPAVAVSIKKVQKELPKEKLPMLGVGAAFSFLVMMFNLPLPGGTTGHAVGATLVAILFGPYAACISVTAALAIQALLFGDGGIIALGANCFNMAFVMPFAGYFIYKFIKDRVSSEKGEFIGAALGAYFSLNIAALLTAVQFGIQPLLFRTAEGVPLYCPYPLSVSVPAMVIPHLLVAGFIEAIFTVFVLAFIKKVSPGTIYEGKKKKSSAVMGLIAALVCLSPLGLLAAGTAWGEWGIEEIETLIMGGKELGYVPQGMANGFSFEALMPDYTIAGMPEAFAYILSALIGAALMIIIFKIIAGLAGNKASGRVK